MSVQKTKFMVTGYDVVEDEKLADEKLAIDTEQGNVEHVEHFQYLGSVISEDGSLDTEIDRRLANASKAFGALKKSVFSDKISTISTKRLKKTHKETRIFASQVYSHCPWHIQQTAMRAAHIC